MTAATSRKVLVICSHEPELDPRIDWVARHAPDDIHRTVVGVADARRPKPPVERISAVYDVTRAERAGLFSSAVIFASHFLRFAPFKLKVAATLGLFVLGIPFLVLYELLNLAYNVATLLMTGEWSALSRRSFLVGAWSWAVRRLWGGGLAATPTPRKQNPVIGALERLGIARVPLFGAMVIHFLQVTAALVSSEPARARDYRLVHANDLDTLGSAVLLKWATGCKVVYDAHEYWPYADLSASRLEQAFWAWLERFLLRYADAAFTVSTPLAEALQAETGFPFMAVANAEPVGGATEPRAAASDAPLRFLFLGTFSAGRGLEELVNGWALLNDPLLHLHLRGPEGPVKEGLLRLAQEHGILGRTVYFEPSVHETELVTCAAQYDVGVIPYKPISLGYRYCCPNKLSQYMKAGVAVLTNDLVYVCQVVYQYGCGLSYDSSRLETLLNAARMLNRDRQRLQEMKRNAVLAAQSEFNWQRQSIPLYDAYRRLA